MENTETEKLSLKIKSLQKLYLGINHRRIDDDLLEVLMEALDDVSAKDLEMAVKWLIKKATKVPTPVEIREGIENGEYRYLSPSTPVRVVSTKEEKERRHWTMDMNDWGLDDKKEGDKKRYIEKIELWKKDHPGLDYFDECLKMTDSVLTSED